MKPGYKTTEFWLTLFSSVLPAIAAGAGIVSPDAAAIAGGAVVSMYNASRAFVKARRDAR